MLSPDKKPKINNVVCTANFKQKVNMKKLLKLPCGTYDEAIYGGRCGYIKTPEMDGKVIVFLSGKIISVGGKSVKKAIEQLNHTKFLLVQEKIIDEIKLEPQVQNIVATINMNQSIPIDVLSSKISNSRYDPNIFPGLILKGLNSCNFLIFTSGKIVITGAKSIREINNELLKLLQKLNRFMP